MYKTPIPTTLRLPSSPKTSHSALRILGDQGDKRTTLIGTSIAPKELEKQARAIVSWEDLGFKVVSLNCQDEIFFLKQHFPNVTFVATKRDAREIYGKPHIFFDDFLEFFSKSGYESFGIVNSDIHLGGNKEMIPFLQGESRNGPVFGHRLDINSLDELTGKTYEKGMDFFFFHKDLISIYPNSKFCLGSPWWDYWGPVVPLIKGVAVKKLTSPFGFHLIHASQYGQENWVRLGNDFFAYVCRELTAMSSKNPNYQFLSRLKTSLESSCPALFPNVDNGKQEKVGYAEILLSAELFLPLLTRAATTI